MGKTFNSGYLQNLIAFDINGNITLPANLTINGNTPVATQEYVSSAVGTEVSNIIANAPETLNTLNELATALGNDPNFATTITNSIGTRVPQARTITINGTTYDLSADRSWTINSISGLTTSYLPKATSATSLGNSQIYDNGTSVGVNTTTPVSKFDVNGTGTFNSITTRAQQNNYLLITAHSNAIAVPTNGLSIGYGYGGGHISSYDTTNTYLSFHASNYSFFTNADGTSALTISSAGAGVFANSVTATSIIKSGGTSSQFLKADGSVDGSTYLTGITSILVTNALGYTPYNSTNPNGYITSSALSPYLPLSGGTVTGTLEVTGNNIFGQTGIAGRVRVARPSDGNATAGYLGFHTADNSDFGIANNSGGGYISFRTNNLEYFRILNGNTGVQGHIYYDRDNTSYYLDAANTGTSLLLAGKTGIGTTSPYKLLTVTKGAGGTVTGQSEILRIAGTDQAVGNKNEIGFANYADNYNASVVLGAVTTSTSGYLVQDFYIATRNGYTDVAPTEHLRITSIGNIGFGTNSPDTKLSVFGTDGSGLRTSPYNVLTITAESGSSPYSGFGGGILFNNRAYTSGIVTSSRIRSVINNNSVDNSGGAIAFDVTSTVGGSLTQAMLVNYNGNVSISYGNLQVQTGNTYSPIYYDYSDSAYFVDPNSTSNIGPIKINGQITAKYDSSADADYGNPLWIWAAADRDAIVIHNTTSGGNPTKLYFRNSNGIIQTGNTNIRLRTGNSNTTSAYLDGGSWYATADMRAPLFYDSENTAYYVNPASSSNLNQLYLNGYTQFAFTNADTTEWPIVRFGPADTANGWDEGIIKANSANGVFGRYGMGIHFNSSRAFGFYTTGWTKVFGFKSDQVYSYKNFYAAATLETAGNLKYSSSTVPITTYTGYIATANDYPSCTSPARLYTIGTLNAGSDYNTFIEVEIMGSHRGYTSTSYVEYKKYIIWVGDKASSNLVASSGSNNNVGLWYSGAGAGFSNVNAAGLPIQLIVNPNCGAGLNYTVIVRYSNNLDITQGPFTYTNPGDYSYMNYKSPYHISGNNAFIATEGGQANVGSTVTGFNSWGLPLVVGSGSGAKGITIYSSTAGALNFTNANNNTVKAGLSYSYGDDQISIYTSTSTSISLANNKVVLPYNSSYINTDANFHVEGKSVFVGKTCVGTSLVTGNANFNIAGAVSYNYRLIEKIGSRSGTGTYSLFTNGSGSTQSSGTVEVHAIYATPSTSAMWVYKISGNRTIALAYSNTTGYAGSTPSVYWSGDTLYIDNSNPSVYYSVSVRLYEIGIGWYATWGNLPGLYDTGSWNG